jgi:hypothetical protein
LSPITGVFSSSANPIPRVINVDKNPAYPAAISALRHSSQPPTRPASIRTLEGVMRSGVPLVFFIYTGAVYLSFKLASVTGGCFPGSSQSPELGDLRT